MEVIHQKDDISIPAWGAVVFPEVRAFRTIPLATSFKALPNNQDSFLKIVGNGVDDLIRLLPGIIFLWINPLGYGVHKAGIALIECGSILLLRIERMVFRGEIF